MRKIVYNFYCIIINIKYNLVYLIFIFMNGMKFVIVVS